MNLPSGLLFLVNIAHCRALRWIACLVYPLALRLGLIAIALFARYLTPERRTLPFGAVLAQVVAILALSIPICAAAFCLYPAWRRPRRTLAGTPLLPRPSLPIAR